MAQNVSARQEAPDTLPHRTAFEASVSLTDSQLSSSKLTNSHLSQDPSASGGFDSLNDSFTPETKTPCTSVSNMSSQEHAEIDGVDVGQTDSENYELGSSKNLQPMKTAAPNSSEHLVHHSNAPKRMVNGELKSPINSLPASPVSADLHKHSRDSSRTLRSSEVGELSSQLKTRLSYAMVKVKHGWQSHSLSDLENLTSSQGSPVSAGLDRRESQASLPNKNLYQGDQEIPASSSYISKPTADFNDKSQGTATRPISCKQEYGSGTNIQPVPRVSATYDSFWRENEESGALRVKQTEGLVPMGPSLAPPADIVPRNLRRVESTTQRLPALHTSNLRSTENRFLPRTPSPKKTPKMRTPSQQAAFEKDAVESLLFMSSPGNSGYHPATTFSATPLRNELSSQTDYSLRTQNPLGVSSSSRTEYKPPSTDHQLGQPNMRKPLAEADVDKMLDEMPNTSSSDDEQT